MDQQTLNVDTRIVVAADSIQTKFEHFHQRNPRVYTELVKLARRAKARGRNRIGISQLFEVLRWEWSMAGLPDGHEFYKLNNNYRSRYARLIMEQEPDLAGIFKLRGLTA